MYSWKYSAILLAVTAASFVALLNISPRALAIVGGSIVGTIADVRFLLIFLIALVFSRKINPIFLAVIAGAVLSIYLQITLQSHWTRLNIAAPSAFDTFWPAFLGALIFLSIRHALLGVWRSRRVRKSA